MSDQKKYHAAIEVKSITSYYLRRMAEIKHYVNESDEAELISKFNEIEKQCNELFNLAAKIAGTEKPPERILKDPDRGIAEFLESSGCGCDDDCSGGCGSCGGGCNP